MKTDSINEEAIPLARAINNEGDLEQNILVAEALTDSDSRDKTLEDKNSKTQGKGYGFEAPVPQDNISSSSGFWGRFDDQQASAVTVLPTDAAFDADIPVANARVDDRKIRHAFIRKVYLILIAQLFVTFGACAFIMLHESTRNFVLGSGMPLYWFNAIMMFVLVCALSVHKRNYPTNVILLSAFTLSSSYIVGTVTAMYAAAGAGDLVLEAVFITATVFIVLTLYTLQSKWDFSFLGAGLGMSLWVLILWGFFAAIFGVQAGYVYALLGSLVFSLFIIYDTYMLAERHDPRDYVIAAVELYLDLINLFLYILRLLGEGNRR
mmetsp:Transcript_12301/g.18876  ORF Transcript_12301/g.18876 Transcript_12301/m.18876 type:complete len:322 (-) Transcript_12301:42-1007(-)